MRIYETQKMTDNLGRLVSNKFRSLTNVHSNEKPHMFK